MATVDREQKLFDGNRDHLAVLLDSIEQETSRIWNDWRLENPRELPDLKGVNLLGANLGNYDFSGAAFDNANLTSCDLSGTNFYCANMTKVKMLHASAYCGQFRKTNLANSDLSGSVFNGADFNRAVLTGSKIHGIGRAGWEIEDVKCDYVYTELLGEGRFPRTKDFESGEFVEIFKSYPLIDLLIGVGPSQVAVILEETTKKHLVK
jgi:hypothetical protein